MPKGRRTEPGPSAVRSRDMAQLYSIPETVEVRARIAECFSAPDFERYEQAAELPVPDPDFRDGIIEAVSFSLFTNAVLPLKRYSTIRKELIEVRARAETAAATVRELAASVEGLPERFRDMLLRHFEEKGAADPKGIRAVAARLDVLASIAVQFIHLLQGADKGGRPKMLAFAVFISRLADLFERATGHEAKAVTYNPYSERVEGRFVALVEAVLPELARLAEHTGKRLEQPNSARARGAFITRLLESDLHKTRASAR